MLCRRALVPIQGVSELREPINRNPKNRNLAKTHCAQCPIGRYLSIWKMMLLIRAAECRMMPLQQSFFLFQVLFELRQLTKDTKRRSHILLPKARQWVIRWQDSVAVLEVWASALSWALCLGTFSPNNAKMHKTEMRFMDEETPSWIALVVHSTKAPICAVLQNEADPESPLFQVPLREGGALACHK